MARLAGTRRGLETPCMHGSTTGGNRETLWLAIGDCRMVRMENHKGTAMTNGSRESDSSIVSGKPSNKVRDNKRAAERVERRELAKGSPSKRNRAWTQSQTILQRELERVREASRKSLHVNTRGRSPVR